MSLTKVSYAMIDGAPVNIKDFGAVGDGTTDDTAAIVAAYNSIASTGGTLYFPNENGNVYAMSGNDTLRIRNSNINIISDGATVKLLTPFASDYSYFSTVTAQNGLFKIYAQTDNVNDYIENITIDGLNFADTPTITGGHSYNIMAMQCRNLRITNCTFARAAVGGVHVTGSQYLGATSGGSGTDYSYKLLYQTTNVLVDDCYFDGTGVQTPNLENNCRVGVQVEGYARNVTISNCSFQNCIKAAVRNIGGIGTLISNAQVWDTDSTVNGVDLTTTSWPSMQVGTSARPDGSVMNQSIECSIVNPNIKSYHIIGLDTQKSLETTVVGGNIYNLDSNLSFISVNGQSTVKVDTAWGRLKAKRHRYVSLFTNGQFSFNKPAGEDNTYQDVTDITITSCNGFSAILSGVVSGLNYTQESNVFYAFNPSVINPRIYTASSSDPTSLSDGDYYPGSIIVNTSAAAVGNQAIVQQGGSIDSAFPGGVTGTSTGGYSFTTNNAAAFHSGMYVLANGVRALVSYIIPNLDATGTVYTYSAITSGTDFAVTVAAPVLDVPNAAKGTTAQRPSLESYEVGFIYLDTTLSANGKPIFWNGSLWVDSAGTSV